MSLQTIVEQYNKEVDELPILHKVHGGGMARNG